MSYSKIIVVKPNNVIFYSENYGNPLKNQNVYFRNITPAATMVAAFGKKPGQEGRR